MKRNHLMNALVASAMLEQRLKLRDNATGVMNLMGLDNPYAVDSFGNARGRVFEQPARVRDAAGNLKIYDSTGAFLVGELERLDQTLNMPLAAVTWGRDIDLREDVTIADEVSSFTLTSFATPGSLGTGNGPLNGKSWIGKKSSQVSNVSIDNAKIPHQLHPWGQELSFTILELESAAKLGRPIDDQKFEGLKLKHQMDIDEMVYLGDSGLGATGLVNNSLVSNVANLPNGAAASPKWTLKTPDEILLDVNAMLTSVWAEAAWAVMPNKILLPPSIFGYISTQKVSSAGNVSILKYVLENNLLATSGQGKLDIQPVKWTNGSGVGGTFGDDTTVNRAVIYNQDKKYVRYPMTDLQRTPIQYVGINHLTTYYCRLGEVEVVYPETIGYRDAL